jgi:hypothetical protein
MKSLICADLFFTSCGKPDGPEKPHGGPKSGEDRQIVRKAGKTPRLRSGFPAFTLIRIELLVAPSQTKQQS